jgi:Leucine-rich repeat (LRR) protein
MFYLRLQQNNLSGNIPPTIFLNCTGLGVVDVGNNNLSGEIPRAISSTTRCQFVVINLYSNKIEGTLPRWIANCTDLMMLDVENNLLDDELPTSIISGKKDFMYLQLSNNRFRSHDDNNLEPFFVALSNCTSLQVVEAGAVGMGGQLPSRLGSLLPSNIWLLNLGLNAIEGPIPVSIGDMTSMTWLNLSSNLLNGTIPTSLCRLESLEQLVLSNNALTGEIPPCIGNATHLGILDLGNNHLSGEIPHAISMSTEGCWFLVLNLYSNNLRGTLPLWLANCTTLMILDVENNLLDDELPTSIISGMKRLMYLDLSNNRFRSHDDNNLEPFFAALSNCTSLQDARGTWDELPSWLMSMMLSSPSRHVLPSWLISMISSRYLLQIVLSNNALMGEIPPSIGNSTNLGELDLSGNMLSGSIPSSIESLAELHVLSLQRNQLSGQIPVESLGRCTKLIRLDLSSNRFTGSLGHI